MNWCAWLTACTNAAGPMAQPIFQPVTLKVLPRLLMVKVRSCHAGKRRQAHMTRVVVKNMLVHFVGDGDDVMLQAQFGDGPQFVVRKDFAGGIMRRVDDDRLGPRS